jgi:UDP-N-acetylglucosamine 2-epimerase
MLIFVLCRGLTPFISHSTIDAGTAKIAGTDRDTIVRETQRRLNDQGQYKKMANAVNPYRDGKTSRRIVNIFKNLYAKCKSFSQALLCK